MLMKIKIDLETDNFEERIAKRVVKAIKPLLTQRKDDVIFDVPGLSQYLGVTPQWIYDKKKSGLLPYFKAGRFLKFRKSLIDEWVASKGIEPKFLLR